MTLRIKRITRELVMINKNLPDGIYIDYSNDDITKIEALIMGPSNTPYEKAFFKFELRCPDDYPHSPPKVKFVSSYGKRIHPNLYANSLGSDDGKVCLSILGTWEGQPWSPVLSIQTVLITIQSLLQSDPIKCEPGHENVNAESSRNYSDLKQYECLWILSNMLEDEKNDKFKKIMRDFILENKDWYIRHLTNLTEKFDDKELGFNEMHCPLTTAHYKNILDYFKEFK